VFYFRAIADFPRQLVNVRLDELRRLIMGKYRKKPVVIEAEQWLPTDGATGAMPHPPAPDDVLKQDGDKWLIRTIEGWLELTPRDWIITGVQGERYPCKPDIFDATYDKEPEI